MQRNREVRTDAVVHENQVTADLSRDTPSRFLKCLGCFAPGDIGECAHGSNGYNDPVSIREL